MSCLALVLRRDVLDVTLRLGILPVQYNLI